MAIQLTKGSVPHHSFRPHPFLTGLFILILIAGILSSLSFFVKDGGTGIYRQQGIFILIVTAMLSLFLIVIATSKMWYKHLWKKNSTHARHKQHTEHHPAYRKKEFPRNDTHSRRR